MKLDLTTDAVQIIKATLQDQSEIDVNSVSDIPQNPRGILILAHDTKAYLCGCCYTEKLEDIRDEN